MTTTGISSRYAQALIDALVSPQAVGDAAKSLSDLQAFSDTVRDSRDFGLILLSPSVSAQKKRAVISRVADAMGFDRILRNFLFVLSDHRRLPLLHEIADLAQVAFDARLGVIRADVTAAQELSEHDRIQLAEALGKKTGRQVRVDVKLDPALIGGVVARVGSTVYDGSVRGRLHALGERLAAETR